MKNRFSSKQNPMNTLRRVGALMAMVAGVNGPQPVVADQVPNPTVTSSATPFNSSYSANNLFDTSYSSEYASQGKVACSAPLVNDGTYVEMDFGGTVTFDRFILVTRNNAVDNVLSNRLYVGNSPTHSSSDTVLSFGSAGNNGQGVIQSFSPVSGRYIRWEVLKGPATGNLGGNQMYFLLAPATTAQLPAPTVINSSTPFNTAYVAAHAVDGFAGFGNNDGSFASAGASTNMFIDFDFGAPVAIAGWDFLNRPVDIVTSYQMIFSNVGDFSTGSTTNTYTASTNGVVWNTVTLAPVRARYVRLQALTSIVSPNTGIREIQFYGSQNASIGQQPQNATNYVWGVQSFSVTAGGAQPLAYQWYRNGTPPAPIPGATNATYTIDPVTNSSAGGYFVVVTNSFGGATSTVATLTVLNPTPDYSTALLAYLAFDETNGIVAGDSSGNGMTATLNNFPTDDSMWVTGRVGGALQFNALDTTTDNQVITDTPFNLLNEDYFSFAFWAKRRSDNNPYNPRIIGPVSPVDGEYWVLWSPANHGVGFYPPAPSPEPIRDVWQHFVVTYDRLAGTYQTFVDGRLKATATSPSYLKTSPAGRQWAIGCKEVLTAFTDPWHGFLDDLRVYNRILLPGDVMALYQVAGSQAPTFDTQPVGADLFFGDTLHLHAAVDGTPPISYQWYRNRTNMVAGATDLDLVIPNVKTSDAGDYTMVAVNALKSATSAVAHVTVRAVTSVTNGLAGYWKFDETSGSLAADSSGRASTGTVLNGPSDGGQWTTGKVGGALRFRGLGLGDDYVVIPAWPKAVNGSMTLSAWVWADARPDRSRIACGGSGTDGTGQFLFTQSTTTSDLRGYLQTSARVTVSAQEGVLFPTNLWQHVVLVADGSICRVYRNGYQVASGGYDGTLFNPTNALSIGARLTADDTAAESGWWQGKMDEVAYWTRGLSPTEVFELYAAGLGSNPVTGADAYANSPPIITVQPQGGVTYLHDPVALQVSAVGPAALAYQWRKDGQPIVNATNAVFVNPLADFSAAGSYAVVVTANSLNITSTPAVVAITAPAPQPEAGLVLYLKLDETSGTTAADSSPNSNKGTLVNFVNPDTSWVAGVVNGALSFSQGPPTADAVAVPAQPYLDFGANPFSLSLWAKGPPAQTESGGLLCKGTGTQEAYCLDIWTGTYRFFVRDSLGQAGANLMIQSSVAPNNQWQHLAIIYDPALSQSRLYINGTLAGIAATADAVLSNGEGLDVGARQYQGGYTLNWTGLLDEVRVYGRAITPLEVRALTYQGIPPTLTIAAAAAKVNVSWPMEAVGYELQSNTNLVGGTWIAVAGVTTNSVSVTATDSALFYRLHRK